MKGKINISRIIVFALLPIGMCLVITSYAHWNESYANDEGLILDQTTDPFNTMMDVVMHKRCMNCHPAGDRPYQGEDSHQHYFNVQRGEEGHGVAALSCHTCHHEENNVLAGVPGAPHWHLAPRSMGWEGMNRIQIAQAMTDPLRNGGRSITEIEKHLTEDPLVLWAFEPGINANGEVREAPPVTKEAFIAAVKEWVANGAEIPIQ